DIPSLPESGEQWRIMRVQAGHAVRRNSRQFSARRELVLHYVHPFDVVPGKRRIHIRRYRTQIFTHNPGAMTVRFKAADREELLGAISNVCAIFRLQAVGDPEQTVKAHYVVDSKYAGVLQLMTQAADEVFIALPPQRLRVKRRKRPHLALGEEGVRRSSGADSADKSIAPVPHVVPLRVKAQRQIKT